MTGGADNVILGPCNPESLRPDLDWLEERMTHPNRPKMVVIFSDFASEHTGLRCTTAFSPSWLYSRVADFPFCSIPLRPFHNDKDQRHESIV